MTDIRRVVDKLRSLGWPRPEIKIVVEPDGTVTATAELPNGLPPAADGGLLRVRLWYKPIRGDYLEPDDFERQVELPHGTEVTITWAWPDWAGTWRARAEADFFNGGNLYKTHSRYVYASKPEG